jgi:hypothetical protein
VSSALQADKFSDVLQVLAEDVLAAFCEHRYGLRAKLQQLRSSRRVVQNVEVDKVDAFFRKKLFRSKATASTRLGEQDEFVIYDFHRRADMPQDQTARNLSTVTLGVNLAPVLHPLYTPQAGEERGGGVTSFENWGCRVAARRPGDLSQCHSEERSDEESACYLFRGGQKHKADPSLRSG